MRAPDLRLHTLAVVGLALALLPACARPVGVRPVDARSVHRHLTRNVLSTGEPSAPSLQVLHRLDLYERFESDPESVLAEIHAGLEPTDDVDRVFALAELSYLHAKRGGGRIHYRAAALYAYAYLFPGKAAASPDPLDPRFRLAADLYNRGLAEGLRTGANGTVELIGRSLPLPFGSLDIAAYADDFVWGRYQMVGFYPVAELEVEGLRNRYRRPGIGAPLGADIAEVSGDDPIAAAFRRVPADVKVPVTALLRVARPRRQLLGETIEGRLEIFSTEDVAEVEIGGGRLPLEAESSSSLAYTLGQNAFGGFELAGFFGSRTLLDPERDGLLMLEPYRRGRIPVVLVHGTASSPAWWANLLNELQNDPRLRDRYQFWLFRYNTGTPIVYSGGLLAETLRQTVAELDPQGSDAALRRMVVVGHSQGGLLTKLTVVDSGDSFWNLLSDTPIDELRISPESRQILERSLFYTPLPFVRCVIFLATPHRGSFRATPGLGKLLSGLVSLPIDLVTLPLELAEHLDRSPEARLQRRIESSGSSIEDMEPGRPLMGRLAELPIAAEVSAHSIIAVSGSGPVEKGNDGVVEYSSAHLEDVDSEMVLHSGHSVQGHPLAIAEVARILEAHATPR